MQPPTQSLILDFIEFLEIQVIHHCFCLKNHTMFFIATIEDLPGFNDLQLEKQRCLIQNDHINTIGLQAFCQFAEKVKLIIEELVCFNLIHQEDSDINIVQMAERGAIGKSS